MKYLLVLIVLIVAYNIWRKQRVSSDSSSAAPKHGRNPGRTPMITQDMVPCAHCGLMLPKNEAIIQGSKTFCSEEHRRQGAA